MWIFAFAVHYLFGWLASKNLFVVMVSSLTSSMSARLIWVLFFAPFLETYFQLVLLVNGPGAQQKTFASCFFFQKLILLLSVGKQIYRIPCYRYSWTRELVTSNANGDRVMKRTAINCDYMNVTDVVLTTRSAYRRRTNRLRSPAD